MSTFTFSNPSSGSVYFVIETIRNLSGFYDSTSLQNIVGTIDNLINVDPNWVVTSSYILGAVVSPGNSSFEFTPTTPIDPNNVYLRGTGPLTVTVDSNPPLTPDELYGPGVLNSFSIDGGGPPPIAPLTWNQIPQFWNQVTSSWEQPIY
jgi:hypothetical protein